MAPARRNVQNLNGDFGGFPDMAKNAPVPEGVAVVSPIQVPCLLFIFGVLTQPRSLIGNPVAILILRRFDSRWPQTLIRCAACAALSDRQIDRANLAIAAGFILPPGMFDLFFPGPVQDDNSAKRPSLL